MAPKIRPLRRTANLLKNEGGFHRAGTRLRLNQRQSALFRQRIGAKLEVNDLAHLPFSTFDVGGSPIGEGGPQALALPTGVHVVEAAVHTLGELTDGIWHA